MESKSVLQQAMSLSPIDRAILIENLLQSFNPSPDKVIETAWANEAEDRISAYHAGKIPADSVENVFKRLSQK